MFCVETLEAGLDSKKGLLQSVRVVQIGYVVYPVLYFERDMFEMVVGLYFPPGRVT